MHVSSRSLALAGTLAALAAALPARAAPQPSALTLETHTAPEAAFLVSSHVVASGDDVLLVDSQMLRDQAEAFIELARRQKGQVRTVFVTHAHPEGQAGTAEARTLRIGSVISEWREQQIVKTAAIIRHRGLAVVKHLLEQRLLLERVDQRHRRYHVLRFDHAPAAA